ncbi:N-acetylneuraminate lyase isoform X3 [Scyliorhinus canicula]|uniref:N-acetylneuraminate lyase isoform X3 n=1 Tax=Scyliorhinus canicula TaxID=7830 RepID=UPI0018F3D009|nr:N-acetylneuraminate lyase isoform X3 [Scyliorhinus canicula]
MTAFRECAVGIIAAVEVEQLSAQEVSRDDGPVTTMAIPRNKLCGLVAATFTPMTQDNEINLSVIGQYVDYLVKVQGIKNIFVNGTTGEGLSLTVEERKLLAEEWISQGKDKLDRVIIHVGSLSIKESQQLAKHAAEYNASGIAVISPFFFKPQSIEALTEFLKEVASAAPSTPFYYYHLPEFTGVSLNMVELLDGIEKRIPTFQGIKFTSSDLLEFGQCVHKYQDRYALLYGKDEVLLSAMVLGASGAVGSTYNYIGNLCNKMLTVTEKGDFNMAREYQAVVQEFIGSVNRFGFGVAENKVTMILVSGIPLGPPRLPLLECSEEKRAKILAKLKILGILT